MTEYFDVVDENDEVIGKASREECHSDKSKIHRSIAVFVFNKDGKILIQKRSKNKDLYPGLFAASCSGHVDSGETYEESAVRELKEELSIVIKEDELKEIFNILMRLDGESEYHKLYILNYDGGINFQKEEIDSVHLISIDGLKEDIKTIPDNYSPALIILFNHYLEKLKN